MKVEHAVVHRIVEQHAAARGDVAAVVDRRGTLTYRDLNHGANAVARHLIKEGFRRGGHALVNMPPGRDLATVLLAVLKVGGAYTWSGATGGSSPWQIAIGPAVTSQRSVYCAVDLAPVLRQPVKPGPNLPVLARAFDVACVLAAPDDAGGILVPHATIAALRMEDEAAPVWEGEATTFDFWAGLMSGATLSVAATPVLADAA